MPAKRVGAAFNRIATPKATPETHTAATRATEKPVKWTLLLDGATARLFDRLASEAYDAAGRKVTKSALIRAALEQMNDDPELRDTIARRAAS